VLTTSARLLRLLAQLQVPGDHTGPSLAAELGVSVRTLRNDVATLRELGYPVGASPGSRAATDSARAAGCLRCCWTTTRRWPLTLGLVLAASHGLSDTAESSMRAFSKVVAQLPARLRPRLEALAGCHGPTPRSGVPPSATDSLPPIAAAITPASS
jgi:predicted DNA-binding transcriptional regulator YafY